MKKFLILIIYTCLFVVLSASAQSFDYATIAPHPRLLLKKGDVSKMRELPAKSANAQSVHNRIMAVADGYLNAEPLKYEKIDNSLSHLSAEALKRIFYLSYAHVMTDDMGYVAAADREMLAVSAFEDWNPTNLSDVAEMTMALSIGYDWLYRRLSVRSRSIIGTAIYEKGLRASAVGDAAAWNMPLKENQICNAGLIYGALATLERSPEYCKSLISKCLESNKAAQKEYGAHGGYPGCYDCAVLGSSFEAMLVAALESSLKTDADLAKQEGFMRSAEFMSHLVAPSNSVFNFGDCESQSAKLNPAKYWFAHKVNNASWVAMDEQLIKANQIETNAFLPLYMIVSSSMNLNNLAMPTSKMWYNEGCSPLFIYRSGWAKEDAYFAIKGGEAAADKPFVDAGSFVYEYDGVRWVVFDGENTHNTLLFNGKGGSTAGVAEMQRGYETTREKGAELDLTPVFSDYATSVKRSVTLDKKNYLTIKDHIVNNNQPSMVEWSVATQANAEIVAPQVIMLTQDGKTLYLRIKNRGNAVAKVWKAAEQGGINRVGFIVELRAGGSVDIDVTLSPVKGNIISRFKQQVLR